MISGLRITSGYEDFMADDVFLAPNFLKECENEKNSFQIPQGGNVYSDDLEATVGLEVEVDLKSTDGVYVAGNLSFQRSVTFSKKGEVIIGNWFISKNHLSYDLATHFIEKIADIIADTANYGNGGSGLKTYDVESFTLEQALASLERKVDEIHQAPFNSCQRYVYSGGDEIYDRIGDYEYESDNYYTWGLIEFLRKGGYVKAIMDIGVEDWSESCAYSDIYIYLTNGSLLILYYDFTT